MNRPKCGVGLSSSVTSESFPSCNIYIYIYINTHIVFVNAVKLFTPSLLLYGRTPMPVFACVFNGFTRVLKGLLYFPAPNTTFYMILHYVAASLESGLPFIRAQSTVVYCYFAYLRSSSL